VHLDEKGIEWKLVGDTATLDQATDISRGFMDIQMKRMLLIFFSHHFVLLLMSNVRLPVNQAFGISNARVHSKFYIKL
jgi:hypothetical protein